ncbi:hypothetical protein SERLA73DRAFT_192494 [Serpula lacrymans var. lacrymans S7.3]|uniref:Uncharacterized protein n=1 Tax=Serpula lacrymans var. lacrymans (strain S7.3) TaxID=936435 RepID=F8QKS0_SERL3|nr:hypothetical protein SERLA73DRAFT_192494 [Serpula lacrymans var. lacrymans S7.3]
MQALLSHNAKVYIAARNQPQSEETIRELKDKTGNEAIFLKLDQVAAEEFLRYYSLNSPGHDWPTNANELTFSSG